MAVDTIDNSIWACKILSRSFLSKTKSLERYEKEIRVLQSLNHISLSYIHQFLFDTDNLYVIMPYYEGTTLNDLFDANKLQTEDDLRSIFKYLAEVTKFMHDQNIYHRNLKIDKILVNSSGIPIITNIHMSVSVNKDSYTNEMMPPELVLSDSAAASCCDIWSLGLILYYLITGYFPFDSQSSSYQGKIAYPSNISTELLDLLQILLNQDPQKRPEISEIISHPWINHDSIMMNPLINRKKKITMYSNNLIVIPKLCKNRRGTT